MTDQVDFDQLWDYDQPAATEQRFTEVLKSLYNAAPDYRLQLFTQIARAQGLQRKFEQAHETLDNVQSQLADDFVVARIRYLLERGRVFNSSGNREEARPLFLQAFDVAAGADQDFYTVDAAHMLGIVEPPDVALEWNLKAIDLAEHSASPRAQNWLGSLYNNIGWTYHDMRQYEDALAIFEKALAWQQAHGKEPNIRIARYCIARTLRPLNRIPDALTILHDIEASNDGYVYEELGECLLLIGIPAEAQPYFELAYEALSKDPWLLANEPDRLNRLAELGGTQQD